MKLEYTEELIAQVTRTLGLSITNHYGRLDRSKRTVPGEAVLVLGALTGSFIFLADLVRQIGYPVHVDFLVTVSYGDAHKPKAGVQLLYAGQTSVKGRDVLLVDDIEDSGATLDYLITHLQAQQPRSLAVCTLLCKMDAAHRTSTDRRWVGFFLPPEHKFLVGYGMGDGQDSRHLPDIYSVE